MIVYVQRVFLTVQWELIENKKKDSKQNVVYWQLSESLWVFQKKNGIILANMWWLVKQIFVINLNIWNF